MTHDEALDFIGRNTKAVLATIKRDSRPQMSHISYTLDDDGVIKISVTGRPRQDAQPEARPASDAVDRRRQLARVSGRRGHLLGD